MQFNIYVYVSVAVGSAGTTRSARWLGGMLRYAQDNVKFKGRVSSAFVPTLWTKKRLLGSRSLVRGRLLPSFIASDSKLERRQDVCVREDSIADIDAEKKAMAFGCHARSFIIHGWVMVCRFISFV